MGGGMKNEKAELIQLGLVRLVFLVQESFRGYLFENLTFVFSFLLADIPKD